MNKKFVICIAFYNQMQYIEECLKSVFSQDYKNIDIILADDCSPVFDEKKIKEIEKKYNKQKFGFEIVRNKTNLGTVKNVNNSLSHIKEGEYLLIFAADDRLHDKQVISNFVNSFNKHKTNVITSQSICYDEKLENPLNLFVDYKLAKKINSFSTKELYYEMCKNVIFCMGATAFKLDIIKKYDLFDESYKYVEDWPAYLKILRNDEKITFDNFVSLDHRDGGISHNNKGKVPKHVIEYYKDMKRIYKKEIIKNLNRLSFRKRISLIIFIVNKYLRKIFIKPKNAIKYKDLHSLIICAYKESAYLEDCLQSLLCQTIPTNVAVSTSTPNKKVEEICRKYGVRLYINKEKSSHSKDFNFAYKQAKTKYVTLCHQDDVYDKCFAEATLKKMEKNSKPIVAFTNYHELRNDKIVKNNKLLIIKRMLNNPLRLFKNSKKVRLFLLSIGNAICAPTITYNKEIVKQAIVESDLKYNIDWISWIEFAKKKGQFIYLKKSLLNRRIHEESTTTTAINSNAMREENYKIFRMFWKEKTAKRLLNLYFKSEESNKLD